jgi:glycosyltransferase involved in cell wall biosynthesis
MVTYNHESYIAQAIESVLMQNTNFEYKLIIGEDCSTDRTNEIVKQYTEKYPDKITAFLNKKNLGIKNNAKQIYTACTAKYIALLEGDDYWTDPLKLQKQVDFLETNPEYGMVCTDYNVHWQSSDKMVTAYNTKVYRRNKSSDITYDDYLIDRSSIGTATALIRKDLYNLYFKEIDPYSKDWGVVGDTPLWLYIAQKSKIKNLHIVTATYRKLENSACNFTDLHKHYEFVKKGYEIPHFFIKKYGCNEITKKKLLINFHRTTLNYGFNTRDQKIAKKSYGILKKNTTIKINDFLRYIKNNIQKT